MQGFSITKAAASAVLGVALLFVGTLLYGTGLPTASGLGLVLVLVGLGVAVLGPVWYLALKPLAVFLSVVNRRDTVMD